MKFYFIFIFLILLDLITVLSARYAYNENNSLFLLFSILSLTMAGYLFIKLLKYELTVVLNILWIAFSTLVVTIFSYFFFNESISLMQGGGMLTIVFGLFLIELYADPEPVLSKKNNS